MAIATISKIDMWSPCEKKGVLDQGSLFSEVLQYLVSRAILLTGGSNRNLRESAVNSFSIPTLHDSHRLSVTQVRAPSSYKQEIVFKWASSSYYNRARPLHSFLF